MTHDARDIANYLLDYADKKSASLTIMVLLKLIYFAHGWHLARYDAPLVKNNFEAWKYGPVVRAVYESFPDIGKNVIQGRAHKFDPFNAIHVPATYNLSQHEEDLLKQVFDAYAHFAAFKLSDLTHEQGSPWQQLWDSADQSTHPGMKISNESIKEHFQRKHHTQSSH